MRAGIVLPWQRHEQFIPIEKSSYTWTHILGSQHAEFCELQCDFHKKSYVYNSNVFIELESVNYSAYVFLMGLVHF